MAAVGMAVLIAAWGVTWGLGSGLQARRVLPDSRLATPQEQARSLSQGIAWIWPDSLGPQAGPKPGAADDVTEGPDVAGRWEGASAAIQAGSGAPAGVPARDDMASSLVTAPPYQEAAVLMESFVLRANGLERGGRQAPLPLPAGVRVLPVIHIEAAPDAPSAFTARQHETLLKAVIRQAGAAARSSGWVQIDFEAPLRQRSAYQSWVRSVREALPKQVKLSVTALAHWCTQGDWLDQLPVDEVVPMLYRLGEDSTRWRERFVRDDPALARRCRSGSLGFATNDPPPFSLLARTPRAYWFDESRWGHPAPSHTPLDRTPS